MFKRFLATLVVMVVAAPAVYAGGMGDLSRRAQMWDLSVQTRYTAAKDYDGPGGSSLSLEDDLGWGFGFGYHVNEKLNVGFLMSWRSIPYYATAVDANDPANLEQYSNWLDTGTFALTADWNILPKRLTPYLNGGIGWTMVNTNIAAGVSGGCYWDPWWGYICGSYVATYGTDAFSYGVGAGLRLEVSEAVFLRVGYEYNAIDIDSADSSDIFRVDAGFMVR